MDAEERKVQRLVALCMLGFVLFNYPVLALFNRPVQVFGIPLGYAFIFVAWAALIGLMALVVRRAAR